MSEHTATPWMVDPGDGCDLIIDAESEPICRPGEANAAFIVRACNAHDELVEAAAAMLENSRANVPTNADTPHELLYVRHRLSNALDKATE